jgi:hypothetical protein
MIDAVEATWTHLVPLSTSVIAVAHNGNLPKTHGLLLHLMSHVPWRHLSPSKKLLVYLLLVYIILYDQLPPIPRRCNTPTIDDTCVICLDDLLSNQNGEAKLFWCVFCGTKVHRTCVYQYGRTCMLACPVCRRQKSIMFYNRTLALMLTPVAGTARGIDTISRIVQHILFDGIYYTIAHS